jgi:hypothetical protein
VAPARAAEFADPLLAIVPGAFHIRTQKQPHAGRRSQSGELSEAIPRANRLRRDSEDSRESPTVSISFMISLHSVQLTPGLIRLVEIGLQTD